MRWFQGLNRSIESSKTLMPSDHAIVRRPGDLSQLGDLAVGCGVATVLCAVHGQEVVARFHLTEVKFDSKNTWARVPPPTKERWPRTELAMA